MKSNRTIKLDTSSSPPSAPVRKSAPLARSGVLRSWCDFWFRPIAPAGLHLIRITAGLLCIAWLLGFVGHADSMLGLAGWFDREAFLEASRLPDGPPVPFGWSVLYVAGANAAVLQAIFWASLAIFAAFTVGLATRITGVLTWVLAVSFLANPAIRSEADYLIVILTFYLMLGYLLYHQWSGNPSIFTRLLGPRPGALVPRASDTNSTSYSANLTLRLLQVHFTVIVVVSGLHKLQFGSWWSGVALWYPMHSPFTTTDNDLRKLAPSRDIYLFFLSLAQYCVLAWQIGFPFFAWRRGAGRVVLMGGALLGWIGCWVIFRMPFFGAAYFVFCLSFVTPDEWRNLLARLWWHASDGQGSARVGKEPSAPLLR